MTRPRRAGVKRRAAKPRDSSPTRTTPPGGVSHAESTSPPPALADPFILFDRAWKRLSDDHRRLFPAGIGQASVRIESDALGRASIDIRVYEKTPVLQEVSLGRAVTRARVVPNAIDLSKPLSEKVPALWDILDSVVADLDGSSTAARQRIIKRFLMHVAGHESQLRTRRQDANGPARSLFQFEAHRAKDAGHHATTLGLLPTLATASGNTASELSTAFDDLPAFDSSNPEQSAIFPSGNLIEARFLDNDLFAAYVIRIDFKRFTAAIPDSNDDQADYWLKFWKGTAPDPAAAKRQFLADCDRVDPFIPA